MTEVELKLIVDEAGSASIWPRAIAMGLCGAPPEPRLLQSIYFDTPEHDLKRKGISLRLRHDGPNWVQTVKYGRELHGGLSRAAELECEAGGESIDLDLVTDKAVRKRLRRLIGKAGLAPVCESRINRTAMHLDLADGSRVELALDIGQIIAGGRAADLREVEIELIKGHAGSLFDLARGLLPEGGFRFSRHSKSERGYMLAEHGRIAPPLEPRNAEDVALVAGGTVEQAILATLRECLEQIAVNTLVVCGSDDPEGPHQLRIGLRRLRSMFGVFKPVMAGVGVHALQIESRWLAGEVGALRDCDAVAHDIVTPLALNNLEDPGFAALSAEMARQAGERRAELRATLRGPRTQSFLFDLARMIETWGEEAHLDPERSARLSEPLSDLAGSALDKCWHKARRKARGLDRLTNVERHELRKQLKKLRYAVEFFAPLYRTRRVRPFINHLKKLQTVFGGLMDAETAQSLLTGHQLGGNPDLSLQRAIGWTIGASQTSAEQRWPEATGQWKALARTRPFWR